VTSKKINLGGNIMASKSKVYRLGQIDKWRSSGMRGTSIVQIKMPNGKTGWVMNKYSPSWWAKAKESDIKRVIVY